MAELAREMPINPNEGGRPKYCYPDCPYPWPLALRGNLTEGTVELSNPFYELEDASGENWKIPQERTVLSQLPALPKENLKSAFGKSGE